LQRLFSHYFVKNVKTNFIIGKTKSLENIRNNNYLPLNFLKNQ